MDLRGDPLPATQGPAPAESEGRFHARMKVGVRMEAVKNRKLSHVTPIRLMSLGWPNQFMVHEVIEVAGKPHLSLWPCCFWMVNRRTGKFMCKAHPAEYFEILSTDRVQKPTDQVTRIDTPWGPILDMDYYQDSGPPVMTLRAFGFPFQITGGVARQLAEALKNIGI